MLTVGFTGTRNGGTEAQLRKMAALLKSLEGTIALHGDCVGADEQFHHLAQLAGYVVKCRPCTYDSLRAFTDAEAIAEPVRPMARNRAIVADSDVMIALPPNFDRIKSGSGTWATIGFTEKARKPLLVVFPDGQIDKRM